MKNTKIFGFHAVLSILEKFPESVLELYIAQHKRDQRLDKLNKLAKEFGVAVTPVMDKTLSTWFPDGNHQGFAALIKERELLQEADIPNYISKFVDPVVLILDSIQDPQNLGACLRTAAAMQVALIIAPRDRSSKITPVVRKIACGAVEQVPFIVVTNLVRVMQQLQDLGIWIAGMDLGESQEIYTCDLTGPIALVMGAEQTGMRAQVRKTCDYLVRIPMSPTTDSLNVALAAGIGLYEVQRQRLQKN